VRANAMLFKFEFEARRQHERVDLALAGRYMLENRREFTCCTIDVSPSGVAVECDEKGEIGEQVIAYIDQLGRIEGAIVRQLDRGFAVKTLAPAAKSEKLASRIAWLVEQQTNGAIDNRRLPRVIPDDERTILRTPDGGEYRATLIDISFEGAAINVETAPPIGSPVSIGQTRGHVVRHFAGGIAVSFQAP
jgi:hypothetical protein